MYDDYRSGDIILLSSVTQVNPVSKGGDHVESEGVEKAQRHLEIIWINTFLSFTVSKVNIFVAPP